VRDVTLAGGVAWAQVGYVPIDPETFTVESIAVELGEE
jgi:hypothetical protein